LSSFSCEGLNKSKRFVDYKMKRLVLAAAVLILAVAVTYAQTVPTSIGVPNSPPFLLNNIPDIFIVVNTNLTNHFNLNDYFIDGNGDVLNFTASVVDNITVTISSNGSVSFYPEYGFEGTRTVSFTATDGEFSAISNNSTILVGFDTTPPQWSNPYKNRENVYQNYFVNFSTTWSDNRGLSHYYFSINQGSGWVSSPLINFSGTSNTSTYGLQISAAGGVQVQWSFTATDLYANSNTTDIQNFTVQEVTTPSSSTTTQGAGSTSGARTTGAVTQTVEGRPDTPTFEVDPATMRVSLRQGDTLTRVVQIKNVASRELSFLATLQGFTEFATINADTFTIPSSESYELLIDFTIPSDAQPDQYFGQLVIQSAKTVVVPIVLDIREFNAAINLEVVVDEDSKFVRMGEAVRAQISIKNLQDVRETPADLYYAIKDFEGNVLESGSEEIILYDSFNEARELRVPQGDHMGERIFYARVIANEIVDLDSDTFYIGSRFKILYWVDKLFYPFLILLLLLVIFLLIWVRERNRKKRELLELYVMLNELRSLVNAGKMEEALEIYKRVKVTYGQHVSRDFLKDKEKLRARLEKFSQLLKKEKSKDKTQKVPSEESVPKKQEGEKEASKEDTNKPQDNFKEKKVEEISKTRTKESKETLPLEKPESPQKADVKIKEDSKKEVLPEQKKEVNNKENNLEKKENLTKKPLEDSNEKEQKQPQEGSKTEVHN